ncbi:MAG: orotate phosphoribosyltransferase [Methanobacteriaceae archaeon]|nr:orotate phosphoribosyltransferase [Methanobacteriaceae archaeon]
MEVRGICNICGQPGKMYTCSMCGALVCGRCFQLNQGICKRCQKGLKFHKKDNSYY